MRVGHKMQAVVDLVRVAGGPVPIIDVAETVGPHGSLCYGYQTVKRAVKAGLVVVCDPIPGRRGMSLRLPESQ